MFHDSYGLDSSGVVYIHWIFCALWFSLPIADFYLNLAYYEAPFYIHTLFPLAIFGPFDFMLFLDY